MKVNENIRKMRLEHGLTLEELGKKLNTSKQTIARYENGTITNIPYDRLEMMAKIFNCSPGDLMGWTETNIQNNQREQSIERIIALVSKLTDSEKSSALGYLEYLANKPQIGKEPHPNTDSKEK